MNVLARDRAADFGSVNTATTTLVVEVEDVADQPPEFVFAPPVSRIAEDVPKFSEVGSS